MSEASDDENDDEAESEDSYQQMKGLAVLSEYLKAGGNAFVLCGVVLFFVCSQLASSGTDYWLSFW